MLFIHKEAANKQKQQQNNINGFCLVVRSLGINFDNRLFEASPKMKIVKSQLVRIRRRIGRWYPEEPVDLISNKRLS